MRFDSFEVENSFLEVKFFRLKFSLLFEMKQIQQWRSWYRVEVKNGREEGEREEKMANRKEN